MKKARKKRYKKRKFRENGGMVPRENNQSRTSHNHRTSISGDSRDYCESESDEENQLHPKTKEILRPLTFVDKEIENSFSEDDDNSPIAGHFSKAFNSYTFEEKLGPS